GSPFAVAPSLNGVDGMQDLRREPAGEPCGYRLPLRTGRDGRPLGTRREDPDREPTGRKGNRSGRESGGPRLRAPPARGGRERKRSGDEFGDHIPEPLLLYKQGGQVEEISGAQGVPVTPPLFRLHSEAARGAAGPPCHRPSLAGHDAGARASAIGPPRPPRPQGP